MGAVMHANVAVVVVNTILLSGLLWLYAGMLRQAATRFTWGLFGFALALWFQNAAQLFFFATMLDFFVADVQPLVLIQNGLALVASVCLLSVTWMPSGRRVAIKA